MKKKLCLIMIGIAALALAGLAVMTLKQHTQQTSRHTDQSIEKLENLEHSLASGQDYDETEPLSISEVITFPETEALPETEPLTEQPVPAEHKVIFVGDSRTVGMGEAKKDDCLYIGEIGEGYNWFIESGLDQMDAAIRAYPGCPVVFNLGVNDCDAIGAYIELYHTIQAAYADTNFYFMSVNPVTEDSHLVPNTDVIAFNEKLQAAFPEKYIDTFSWMSEKGFDSVDGVHYSKKQYRKIHDYAVRWIMQNNL